MHCTACEIETLNPNYIGAIQGLSRGYRGDINVGPCLMIGGPPPGEQLPFLFNTAASPKFDAQLKSINTWNFGSCVEAGIRFRIRACTGITISIQTHSKCFKSIGEQSITNRNPIRCN